MEKSVCPGFQVTSYAYDDRSMLEELALNLDGSTYDQTWTWARNQAGQITQRTSALAVFDAPAPGTFSTAYAANGLNQLTDAGANDLTYDGRGNLADDDVSTYGFDLLNRLTNVNSGAAVLSYDPLGRLAKVDATNDVLFLYDGGDLIAEYSTGGSVLRRYVHGPNYDEPLVWYEGSGTGDKRYYVSDQLGSIVAVTNSSGAAMDMGSGVYTKAYDEYGNPGPVVAFGRFAYTGQTYVPEAGAYYYKARFYSPALGRFLSPDPIGYGDGANMYAYVGNDPINAVDPTGLRGVEVGDPCNMQTVLPEGYACVLERVAEGTLLAGVTSVAGIPFCQRIANQDDIRCRFRSFLTTVYDDFSDFVTGDLGSENVEACRSGRLNLIPQSEGELHSQAEVVETPFNSFLVVIHGSPEGVTPTGNRADRIAPIQLLEIMQKNGYQSGTPITLGSCNIGQGTFPDQLANASGATVYSPTNFCTLYSGVAESRNAGPRTAEGRRKILESMPWRVSSPAVPVLMGCRS